MMTRNAISKTTIVAVGKENVAIPPNTTKEMTSARLSSGIRSPAYQMTLAHLTLNEVVENENSIEPPHEANSATLDEANSEDNSRETLNSSETPVSETSSVGANSGTPSSISETERNTSETGENEIPAESEQKIITICTGELKAFFPVTVDHVAVIDETYMASLKYPKYYEVAEHLEVNVKVPWMDKEAGVADGRQLKKLNVTKRGTRRYACPYCGQPAPAGDKNTITRHMNSRVVGKKTTRPACIERRRLEPQVNGKWEKAKREPKKMKLNPATEA